MLALDGSFEKGSYYDYGPVLLTIYNEEGKNEKIKTDISVTGGDVDIGY
jgi:hypothetical protein